MTLLSLWLLVVTEHASPGFGHTLGQPLPVLKVVLHIELHVLPVVQKSKPKVMDVWDGIGGDGWIAWIGWTA